MEITTFFKPVTIMLQNTVAVLRVTQATTLLLSLSNQTQYQDPASTTP